MTQLRGDREPPSGPAAPVEPPASIPGAVVVPESETVWAAATSGFDRWLNGEATGLDDLVAAMTPVLWQVVRGYRLSEEQAEDVVQTTWLSFVRRHAAILDTAAVGGWLTMTARREAWRVAKRAKRDLPVEDDALELDAPQQRSAESEVVEGDRDARLWAAVEGLPERCRRLLRVVAFESRPDYTGLADELGMPVGSIGPTRGRCLAKLRTALEQLGAHGKEAL